MGYVQFWPPMDFVNPRYLVRKCVCPSVCLLPRRQAVFLECLFYVSFDLCSLCSQWINKLSKVCPRCSITVYVRRAVCGCGHAFPSIGKAQFGNMSQALRHRRADRLNKANMRASETPEQLL